MKNYFIFCFFINHVIYSFLHIIIKGSFIFKYTELVFIIISNPIKLKDYNAISMDQTMHYYSLSKPFYAFLIAIATIINMDYIHNLN